MADYGFRLTRDACGKHSVPETLEHSWKIDELRQQMKEKVVEEISKLESDKVEAVAIEDNERNVVEIREKFDKHLIAYYEIEEFEHC